MADASLPEGAYPEWIGGVKQGILLGAAILALTLPRFTQPSLNSPSPAPGGAYTPATNTRSHADFSGESTSAEARSLADWVVRSGDNRQLFFVLIDKKNTKVFVFDPSGKLRGATPVLIGAARGDDTVAGIGSRPIAEVAPHERTTPAGRFTAEPGHNASGEDVVWVDYDAAVSMHRVRANEPKERRLERLASPGTDDNRISYGCINVPVDFYERVVKPAFTASRGIVYVLPEVKSLGEVFTALDDGGPRQDKRPAV